MEESTRVRSAALFASLGHPTRIAIVELLADQKLSVNEISEALGLGQSSTSQHLAALLRSGVLAVTPQATKRLYRTRGPRIGRVLALISEFCEVQGLKGDPEMDHAEL